MVLYLKTCLTPTVSGRAVTTFVSRNRSSIERLPQDARGPSRFGQLSLLSGVYIVYRSFIPNTQGSQPILVQPQEHPQLSHIVVPPCGRHRFTLRIYQF
jgi:hypothetical protein